MLQNWNRFFLISIIAIVIARPILLAEDGVAIHLPFGSEPNQIMRSGDNWFPLFFSVSNANILVPDFYRQRIMVYSLDGRYQASLEQVSGLTPRLNYFNRTAQGSIVIFTDGALLLLSSAGEVLWRINFPLGTIPQDFFCGSEALYVLVQGESGPVSLEIPYERPRENRIFTAMVGGTAVPAVRSGSTVYPWQAMATSPSRPDDSAGFVNPGPAVPRGARLLDCFPDGSSLWLHLDGYQRLVYHLDARGQIQTSAELADPTGANNSWVQVRAVLDGQRLSIYYLSYDSNGLTIHAIRP
ncbi:MAG TPA: hypothetical protein DCX65_04190 [Spirochaetaceae bacterium]|nr:hypothetical protein [Spirochaetaceae bacterium]HAW85476.1 hypothetical protein [Spirochaetaceae bacterium]HCQ86148.1 hypothetical protein [Spirochaetaceae bacterium]